jgi:RNA polymerase sigma-70 factor (ECF subfamily)
MTGTMAADNDLTRLLDQAKGGDRQAFDRVASDLRERLVAFVRSRLGQLLRGKFEPEDIVQETLLRAFESIHAFRGTDAESLWSWLTSISEHLILNASRKRSTSDVSLSLERAGTGVSPSRGLRRKERLARLERSLAQINPEHREVIILAKIDGLRAREIAQRLGRSEAAVRQAISRGLKELREQFGDTESLHLPREQGGQDALE